MTVKPKSAFNRDLSTQIKVLTEIIEKNEIINEIISKAPGLGIENYYIGAGAVVQTIWNYLSGFPLEKGINDIDFVYYDDKDLSPEGESRIIEKVEQLYSGIPIKKDVKNQARVHIWYENRFGYSIKPYKSLEEAINTWPTTATAVGVRKNLKRDWIIYAPFGLNDLFGKIVRPNKIQITKEIYEAKVNRWTSVWHDLTIIPWYNN